MDEPKTRKIRDMGFGVMGKEIHVSIGWCGMLGTSSWHSRGQKSAEPAMVTPVILSYAMEGMERSGSVLDGW